MYMYEKKTTTQTHGEVIGSNGLMGFNRDSKNERWLSKWQYFPLKQADILPTTDKQFNQLTKKWI